MEYQIALKHLSQDFFNDYPKNEYPELLHKPDRPYNCLLINANGYFICVPFRSAVKHKNAYLFKTTERSKRTSSGLDFSKLVIISDLKYFDTKAAIVDKDEYKEAMDNIHIIVTKVASYVKKYIEHMKGIKEISQKEYDRNYKYSTLPYFNNIIL